MEYRRIEVEKKIDLSQLRALMIEDRGLADFNESRAAADARIDETSDEHRSRRPLKRLAIALANHFWRRQHKPLPACRCFKKRAIPALGDFAQTLNRL